MMNAVATLPATKRPCKRSLSKNENQPAGQHVMIGKIPPLTIQNINDPLQRTRKLYYRMGCPTRDEMKARIIQAQQANNKNSYDNVTVADVDLLPWNGIVSCKHSDKVEQQKESQNCKQPEKNTRRRLSSSSSCCYIPQPGESLTVDPLGSLEVKSFDTVYKMGDQVNDGAFGVVYEARHVLNKKPEDVVAVKIVNRKNDAKDQEVIRETTILKDIRHLPYITKLVDFYMDTKSLYIVQELARGGDVLDRLIEKEVYTEEDARTLAENLFMATKSLHDFNIVHRDFKPENLLLRDFNNDTDILLCDFGNASYLPKDGSGLRTRCGTPAYVAPEILAGFEYGAEVDMWSIGCIIFMLLCGERPFEESAGDDLYESIIAAEYYFDDEMWDIVSLEAKSLITNLLTLDRKKRFSVDQALDVDWFATCTESELEANDITESLVGIRNYCEHIRPEEKCSWHHEESEFIKTLSDHADMTETTLCCSDHSTDIWWQSQHDAYDDCIDHDVSTTDPHSKVIKAEDETPSVLEKRDSISSNRPEKNCQANKVVTRTSELLKRPEKDCQTNKVTRTSGLVKMPEKDCQTNKVTRTSELVKSRFDEAYTRHVHNKRKQRQEDEGLDKSEMEQRKKYDFKMDQLWYRLSMLKQRQHERKQ